MADAPHETSIQAIGRTLYQRARAHSPGFYAGRRWVLKRVIADARLRDALFQFVYLRQFVWSRMVSSNRLLHGYVPGLGN